MTWQLAAETKGRSSLHSRARLILCTRLVTKVANSCTTDLVTLFSIMHLSEHEILLTLNIRSQISHPDGTSQLLEGFTIFMLLHTMP